MMTDIMHQMDATPICNCGPCQRFWQDTFKNSCLEGGKEDKLLNSRTVGKVRPQMQLSVGDRVTVQGKTGCVKFVDFVDDSVMAPVLRVGIKLDESIPEGHDGMYRSKRYFHCTEGHGIFARITEVEPLQTANKRPPVRGNPMFPSWPDVHKKRKDQEALLEKMQEKKMREKKRATAQRSLALSPRPPTISPRENRAHQLRREMICLEKVPGEYCMAKEDPSDMAFKDQQKGKKRDFLAASLSTPRDQSASWEKGLRKQWRRKYNDPEKVSRMEETLLKLRSAYEEGSKFKHVHIYH